MMKRAVLTLAVALVVVFALNGVTSARAETVRTTKTSRIMKRPGEQSQVVLRVPAGEVLTVIAKEGRWYKVRVNGRTGWVTRSSVVGSGGNAKAKTSDKRKRPFVDGRSSKRGWGGDAPDDRVGADSVEGDDDDDDDDDDDRGRGSSARDDDRDDRDDDDRDDDDRDDDDRDDDRDDDDDDREPPKPKFVTVTAKKAKLRAEPSSRADSVGSERAGTELMVVGQSDSGEWIMVENRDGDEGWVRADDVTGLGYNYPKATKRGGARLGYATVAQTFASNGAGELANYGISSAAASLFIGGEYIHRYSPTYLIGVSGQYVGSRASPGIRYQNAMGQAADIGFTMHEVDLGVGLGYNLKHKTGAAIYGKLGYHYGLFSVADVGDFTKNLAMLPSEVLQGITVGTYVDLPRVTPKLAGRASVDLLYPSGKRSQTAGLEDGAVSDVFAAWASLVVAYQWKPDMTLDAGYRYSYSKTEWEGAAADSMRPHAATAAARKDTGHALSVGLAKTF